MKKEKDTCSEEIICDCGMVNADHGFCTECGRKC